MQERKSRRKADSDSGERSSASARRHKQPLEPKLFAIIVQDQVQTCVWAFSAREARGKAEPILGGGRERSFAESVRSKVYPVEVTSVAQRLQQALGSPATATPGELAQSFVVEAAKAVLVQVLGMKPEGFGNLANFLLASLPAADLAAHFPGDEVFVMWEGAVLARAASWQEFAARYSCPVETL